MAPVREHLQWLADTYHLSTMTLAHLTGVPYAAVNGIRYPDSVQGRIWVTRETADRVLALRHPDPNAMPDTMKLTAVGTRRRLRALGRLGYTREHMADIMGTHPAAITKLQSMRQATVTAGVWRRVAAMYDKLSMDLGPSASSRKRAERSGWEPPLAWDDDLPDLEGWHPPLSTPASHYIDDPYACPADVLERPAAAGSGPGGGHARADLGRVQELFYAGWPLNVIAADMGVKPDSIVRKCWRHGLDDFAKVLEAAEWDRRERNDRRRQA